MLNNSFNKSLFPFAVLITILMGGCKTYAPSQQSWNRLSVLPSERFDSSVYTIYAPYKKDLESEMQKQMAVLSMDLYLDKPVSTLGTMVVSILKWQIKQSLDIEPDFCFYNFGGIRTPSLARGPIYVNDAYQLLPFDNMPVVIKISGRDAYTLFQVMAVDGGWPISDASYHIKNGMATNIYVRNLPLDTNQIYTIGTIDFLAQGGDNMTCLKPYTSVSCNVLMRDAALDYWGEKNKLKEEISVAVPNNIIEDE